LFIFLFMIYLIFSQKRHFIVNYDQITFSLIASVHHWVDAPKTER